jgi:outer membrane lipoprotein SlyB
LSNTAQSPRDALGDAPLRAGSSFSRPAALIGGGAVALIALTAIATTLVMKPPATPKGEPGAQAAVGTVAAQSLMSASTGGAKASGKVIDEGPANKAAKSQPGPQRVATTCTGCGVVESVTPVTQKGEAKGVGAVGGAVLGGVIGHQMGGGRGKDAMTAIGVVGGGIAGHEVEKRARATTTYQVKVRMEDGSMRTVTQSTAPAVGQKVTVEGSQLKARA